MATDTASAVDELTTLRVAQLYYEHDLTQADIARHLGVTRWKVGRLLARARETGLVRIEIHHPSARMHPLEKALVDRFGLREAVVVPTQSDEDALLDAVGRAAADFLCDLRPIPQLLGVSWGHTMAAVAHHVRQGWGHGVHVVQVKGGVSRSSHPTSGTDIAARIAHAGGGSLSLLPVPSIVEHASTRAALEQDRAISGTLQLARAAQVLVFGLGALSEDSVLVESGYLCQADIARLRVRGAVGDINSRFITADGDLVDPELDARTLGLELTELGSARWSIAVASGNAKHDVIAGGLRSKAFNVLVTDESSAIAALETR